MSRVFTLLLLVLERLNGFGPERLCSAQNEDSKIMRSIAICFVRLGTWLWHMPRNLTNLVIGAEWLMRFEPDRRCLTQETMGTWLNRYLDAPEIARGTCQCAIQLDKIVSRIQTSSPIEKGKTAFDSSLWEEADKVGSASPCIKRLWQSYRGLLFKSQLVQKFLK